MKGCRIEIYDWGSGSYLVADRKPLGGDPVQGVANSRPSPTESGRHGVAGHIGPSADGDRLPTAVDRGITCRRPVGRKRFWLLDRLVRRKIIRDAASYIDRNNYRRLWQTTVLRFRYC